MARRTRSLRLSAPLSPEVLWYLETRGYEIPTCVPLIRTPEPRDFPGAVFDPDRVDAVIKAIGHLRHTKGEWAGQPIVPTAVQVAYIIAPVFGWVAPSEDDPDVYVRIMRASSAMMPWPPCCSSCASPR